ncbi:unnamed protein product [Effrenium voratum]|nr:unnamed protein product [Effrenium voratum]
MCACRRARARHPDQKIGGAAADSADSYVQSDSTARVAQAAAEPGSEAFAGAEELSFRQEVMLEGPLGTVLLKPSCAGRLALGDCLWTLGAFGVRLVLGCCSLRAAPGAQALDLEALTSADAVLALGIEAGEANGPGMESQLQRVVTEATAVLKAGGNLLAPIRAEQAFTEDLVEFLARGISELPEECQAPIFAIGAPAQRLRRCRGFSEWASKKCQERAHAGEHPFLIDPLVESGRVVLGDTVGDLADTYQEPCVVLVPAQSPLAAHFEKLWAKQAASKQLLAKSDTLPGVGCISQRMVLSELVNILSSASRPPKLLLPKGVATPGNCKAQLLPYLQLTDVVLDLSLPRVECWLPRSLAGKRPADVLPLHGTLLGQSRPRVAHRRADVAPLFAGEVDLEAFQAAMRHAGCPVEGGPGEWRAPALSARILFSPGETLVECPSGEGRRRRS